MGQSQAACRQVIGEARPPDVSDLLNPGRGGHEIVVMAPAVALVRNYW